MLDRRALGPTPDVLANALFDAGVDWIQLRDRKLGGEALYDTARALVAAAKSASSAAASHRPAEPRILINRRIDVALAVGAHGVHLGFDAVDAAQAHSLLGNEALVGRAFHSLDEVHHAAAARGPDALAYAHLAPIWAPVSKPSTRPPLGVETLEQAAAGGLPILAQGGIDEERARQSIEAGASGVAVTGLLNGAEDPPAVARILRKSIDLGFSPKGTISRNQKGAAGDTGKMP